MDYKEGKDFKWVPMKDKKGNIVKDGKGNPVKTRKFFTKAEKDQMKEKSKSETKGKSKTKSESPAPKSTSKRPQARRTEGQIRSSSGNRSRYTPSDFTKDGGPRRGSVKPKRKDSSPPAMTESPSLSSPKSSGGAPIIKTRPDREVSTGYGTLANATNRMESFKVSRQDRTINGVSFDDWKKLTRAERVEKNLPLTNQEFMRAMRLKGADSTPAVPKSSKDTTDDARARATRTNRSRNSPDIPGMAKGGMVKSGNKDYKNSGMFYKSGSPRGYK